MDVHKESISVAALLPGCERPEEFKLPNTEPKVRKLIRTLKKRAPGEIRCCYEAGSCGFTLQRQFTAAQLPCDVIAPSLIPRKPGEHVKTDRRDAAKLASYLRAGQLTVVVPPDALDEDARDACRAREAMRKDRLRLRHRILKLLLRRGLVYREGRNWTAGHARWLRAVSLAPLPQEVLNDLLLALEQLNERVKAMEQRIAQLATEPRWRENAVRARCVRGIDTLSAMILLTEMHSVARFATARSLMNYAGLVGSEHSSGDKVRHGPLIRSGNNHMRRILIEAAWNNRYPPKVSAALRQRRAGAPPRVIARADRFMRRAHRRFLRLTSRNKTQHQAICAIARELAGCLWDCLQDPVEPAR